MRVLGLDPGTVRLGVALSDAMGWTAQPLEVVRVGKVGEELDRIAQLIEEHNVSEIVVGLPLNMDGSEGPKALESRQLIEKLQVRFELPIHAWDERLTTVAAERALLEGDVRRDKRKNVIDKVAAAYMLQGFLDHRSNKG